MQFNDLYPHCATISTINFRTLITTKETLYPSVVNHQLALPPVPSNHTSLSLYGFAYSGHFI